MARTHWTPTFSKVALPGGPLPVALSGRDQNFAMGGVGGRRDDRRRRAAALTDVDYIVVGAGSAGCVLAKRLTENGRHKVLLLEAGGSDRRFFLRMPIGYGMAFYNPQVNWMYRTEPESSLSGRQGY